MINRSFVLVSFVGLLAASASGCAVESAVEGSDVAQTEQALISPTTSHTVPFADGVRFLDVTAQGTGCPANADAWSVDISPDGQTFTVTFSQYEASIVPGQAFKTVDCQLNVKLRMPGGMTYAVESFDYAGYVFLDKPGMSATQRSTYYFQGDRVAADRGTTKWTGPVDKEYVVRDQVAVADMVWKPCGVERSLQIPTRLTLRNNPSKSGEGYVSTQSVDAAVRFVINLAWRQCY